MRVNNFFLVTLFWPLYYWLMTYLELVLLAVGLCFDTFAVSISGGMQTPQMISFQRVKVISVFGILQAMFLFAGWAAGTFFASFINEWDHWIAFVILLYLGVKMVYEGARHKEDDDEQTADFLKLKRLVMLAVATSIDAVAVGVSLAFMMLPALKICFAVLSTAAITALASYIGIKWGQALGTKIGKKAEIAGSVILVAIGIKILVEHLCF